MTCVDNIQFCPIHVSVPLQWTNFLNSSIYETVCNMSTLCVCNKWTSWWDIN